MEQENQTHKIIGCAYKVYNTLGFGFLESIYHKAMRIELAEAGLSAESEEPLKVHYKDKTIGEFAVDIYVENEIIVELKSVEHLVKAHEVQVVNYLTASKKEIGLLINFGPTGVKVKRKYRKTVKQDLQDQQD